MSLIVLTFHRDPVTKEVIYDPYPEEPGRDLAGFEAWRTLVWGSQATRKRGGRFLPQLADSDLYVENEDLDAFESECQILIETIDSFAAEVNSEPDQIKSRLENFLWAVNQARYSTGGVYIG